MNRLAALLVAAVLLLPAIGWGQSKPKVWLEPHTEMPFVELPKGCFQMGTNAAAMKELDPSLTAFGASLWADERPQHQACVDAFLMGQFEVRASDWVLVMGAPPPFGRDAEPAAGISFDEAQAFARRLTELSDGKHRYRLPTEAEWEYACRAKEKQELLPFRDNRVDVGWYSVHEHRVAKPSRVGQLKANAWGLHDMLGNVWEWVVDGYRANGYATHALYNPLVSAAPDNTRVMRGGSHRSDYIQLRCANRSSYPADAALSQMGLRLVRIQ